MNRFFLKIGNGFLKIIDKTILSLSVTAMLFMLFLTFANVIGRYVFQHSIGFSEELCRFLFVWVVFLGAAIIIKDNGHVAVEFLALKLKGTLPGKIVKLIINFAGLLFIGMVFSGGMTLARTMNIYSSASLGIPMGYVYWGIPIGSGIMFIHQLINFVKILRTSPEEEMAEESTEGAVG